MKYKKGLLLFSLTILIIIFGEGLTKASNLTTIGEASDMMKVDIVRKDENMNTLEESKINRDKGIHDENYFEVLDFDSNKLNLKSNSKMSEGWKHDGKNWQYFDKTGKKVISKWIWAPILNKDGKKTGKYNWKYFNYQGNNINQFYTENGKVWLSQESPQKEYMKGWWINPDNGFKYFFRLTSGTRVSGRQYIDDNWRFFRESGTLAFGRQYIQGGWTFFRLGTGTQAFGWQYYDGAWRYNDPEDIGHEYHSTWQYMSISTEKESNSWKYFNKNGENVYQIYNDNNNSYLTQPGPNTGFKSGWWKNPSTDQNYFFRNTTGTMVKRWQYIDGMWRFFRDSGTQAFGLQYINGEYVYLEPDTGAHLLGRQFVNGKWMDFGEKYDYVLEKYVDKNLQDSDIHGDTNELEIFKLVIDPGHGGGIIHNRGGLLFNEGDQNYHFAQAILKEASRYKNILAITTRPNIDDDPSFEDRAKAGSDADLFVSVHTNAGGKYVRGVEVWGSQKNTQLGHDFAIDIASTWSKLLKTPNRGVMYDYRDQKNVLKILYYPDNTKEDTWFIYKGNTAKQKLLLESVFHTNLEDSTAFLNNQELLAKEFMDKVAKHFGIKLK